MLITNSLNYIYSIEQSIKDSIKFSSNPKELPSLSFRLEP